MLVTGVEDHVQEMKCVGDNFEMLMAVLVAFVTNILHLPTLASGYLSSTLKIVINIKFLKFNFLWYGAVRS